MGWCRFQGTSTATNEAPAALVEQTSCRGSRGQKGGLWRGRSARAGGDSRVCWLTVRVVTGRKGAGLGAILSGRRRSGEWEMGGGEKRREGGSEMNGQMGRWADGVRWGGWMHDKTTRQRRRGRRASPGTLVELHAVSMHVAAMASPLPLVLGGGRGGDEGSIRSCLVRTSPSHPTALPKSHHEKSVKIDQW